MTNCYNTGIVVVTTSSSYTIGGVLGYNNYGKMHDCYNTASVLGLIDFTDFVGGVVGYNTGTVYDCHNTGNVTGNEYVGGILGRNGEEWASVDRVCNTGNVSGWRFVGGVTGYNKGKVTNSYNLSNINGKALTSGDEESFTIGGVVGSNHDGGSVDNCYNAGTVSGLWYAVGSVIGFNNGATVTNCYYLAGCATDGLGTEQKGIGYGDEDEPSVDVEGSTAGVTAKQLASGEIAYLLQGNKEEQVWGQKIGAEKQPALSDDKVYCVTEGEVVLGYSNVEGQLPVLGVTVSGNVSSFLEGDVTVELIQDGEEVYSATVSGGEYAIEGVVAGEYTLRISKANHAPVEMAITVGEEAATFDTAICPIGDVTGDGVVNIKDFQRLLRHVNKTNPLTDYELACGDVTGDGVCNIKDFQRLLRHVNKTNPLF